MTSAAIDTLRQLGLHVGMLEGYEKFLAVLDRPAGVPERVVALCRLRVAAIHGAADQWDEDPALTDLGPEVVEAVAAGNFTGLNPSEQAALALVERVPFDWHGLTDEEVDASRTHFGAEGCVGLITAIAFLDANHRLAGTLSPSREQEN